MKARNGRMAILERPHPAVTVLKQATAEIRALNDTLGLSRKASAAAQPPERKASPNAKLLKLMFDERDESARKAAGA